MAIERAETGRWGESKSQRLGLLLTPTAKNLLEELRIERGLPSISEVIEYLVRDEKQRLETPKVHHSPKVHRKVHQKSAIGGIDAAPIAVVAP